MPKTNHQRGFADKRLTVGQRSCGFVTFSRVDRSAIDGVGIAASATVASENSRSIARDKAGAKKFINSRRRRSDRDAIRKICLETE